MRTFKLNRSHLVVTSLIISALAIAAFGPFAKPSDAAFGAAMVRLDRMKASTATTGRVCAKPSAANLSSTEADVKVTFPTGFTVSSTAANWTVSTTNLDSGQSAWPGISTATAVSGQTVTFPSTDLSSSSTLYCFNWTGGTTLTNPTAANNLTGTITTEASGPVTIDSSSYALSVIADDQIQVSATVGASFTFALSTNSASIGALDSSSTATSGNVVGTVTTNAAGGWTAWAKDANNVSSKGALHSASASYNIAGASAVGTAARTLTNGTEDYGMGITGSTHASGTGASTPPIDAAYDSSAGTKIGTLNPLAYSTIVSNNGTAGGAGDTFTMVFRSTISTLTQPATDYSDIVTVVAAGTY